MNTKKSINKLQVTNNANSKKEWITPEIVDFNIVEETSHYFVGSITDGFDAVTAS